MHESKPKSRWSPRSRPSVKSREGSQSINKSLKQLSQKEMLSKALQKANTAVLLDNAQNFEGAKQAYLEACSILYQVMLRSSGDDHCQKLEAIHNTYTSRINELEKIDPQLADESKALPARPEGDITETFEPEPISQEDIATEISPDIVNDQKHTGEYKQTPSQLPPRRESLLQIDSESSPQIRDSLNGRLYPKSFSENMTTLESPTNSLYMPPPLSPKRPFSANNKGTPNIILQANRCSDPLSPKLNDNTGDNGPSGILIYKPISWLHKVDKPDEQNNFSSHSRKSSRKISRKFMHPSSNENGMKFDAALDAAVDAAFDDGFQLMDLQEAHSTHYDTDENFVDTRWKFDLAMERTIYSEREAVVQSAQDHEGTRHFNQSMQNQSEDEYDSYDVDEEERLLEEMTRDIKMTEMEPGSINKSFLRLESYISSFSQRTWNSSEGLNPAVTSSTKLNTPQTSTIPQVTPLQPRAFAALPLSPPPELPPLPSPMKIGSPALSLKSNSPVENDSRLSRSSANQPRMEIATKHPPDHLESSSYPTYSKNAKSFAPVQPKAPAANQSRSGKASTTDRPFKINLPAQNSSVYSQNSPSNSHTSINNSAESQFPVAILPSRTQSKNDLRPKISSSSLKKIKARHISASNNEDGSDTSPNTPEISQLNGRFEGNKNPPSVPYLPSSIAITIEEKTKSCQSENMSIFTNDINPPESPVSVPAVGTGAPIPLEPCPTEYILRPFWLMRALYQTITHPKGGYISSKLFIPCDVWRVKGVKIKNLEEKIANCDLLTNALNRLARVDSYDADAVLDEMQALEVVIEQAQAALSKKLGNDVGVQSFSGSGVFKDASNEGDSENTSNLTKSGASTSKSSFSWRRLRSKNSGVGLSSSFSSKAQVEYSKENLRISSLPMATAPLPKSRFVKRDPHQISFSGPNAGYMGALARLFDSAQTVDQIARQVEDPGLRHADKTQVGLELSTRHVAEFFGFYICRFVLADVTMLLDKFIKRGGEWVLV